MVHHGSVSKGPGHHRHLAASSAVDARSHRDGGLVHRAGGCGVEMRHADDGRGAVLLGEEDGAHLRRGMEWGRGLLRGAGNRIGSGIECETDEREWSVEGL